MREKRQTNHSGRTSQGALSAGSPTSQAAGNTADTPVMAFDVTRLFLGPLSLSPRGIDRIDLILAKHFFREDAKPAWGLLPTPWGVRLYPASRVRRGLAHVQVIWAEGRIPDDDPTFRWLRNSLQGKPAMPPPVHRKLSLPRKAMRMIAMLRATGFSFGAPVHSTLPANAAYLNVGQFSLALEPLLSWLKRRKDVNAVFMLHDAIPVQRPDLVARSSARFHSAMLENTKRYATSLIVSTEAAKREIKWHLSRDRPLPMPTLLQRLPLGEEFDSPPPQDTRLAACKFFVVCGAIEKRKNLLLLLDVWRHLTADLGAATPHLAVVGAPHFGADQILAAFANCAETREKIHVAHGLSTPALKVLIAHAQGLLMPSLAEGFGLPLLEAVALGCPVLASDIPAHREVLEGCGILLPTDAPGQWAAAIKATGSLQRPEPIAPHQLRARREGFVGGIEHFLAAQVLSQSTNMASAAE